MTEWDHPTVLVVMDGYGISEKEEGNAIAAAETPNVDKFSEKYPSCLVPAHGEHVGLLPGGLGGSEVGHMHIGSGKLVPQMPKLITESIRSGEFYDKDVLRKCFDHASSNNGRLHLMGLCSDKGIHSLLEHLYGVLEAADTQGFSDIVVHMFLDGRDTEPKVAKRYVEQLEEKLEDLPGEIGTVSGRYYGMDRDKRWDRTEKAYKAIVYGEGRSAESAFEAVERAYDQGETDEFVKPTVINGFEGVDDGDSVFVFNFRADRCIQMAKAFTEPNFSEISSKSFENLFFSSMTRYSEDLVEYPVAFEKNLVENTLGEVVSEKGGKCFRIAETEKKAHVTYFFSGRRESPFEGESRKIFNSPKVDVYDKTPGMRAEDIKEKTLEVLKEGEHDLVVLNFANCDMVGHTGVFDAAVEAAETVDRCVGELQSFCKDSDYTLILTADHGNADEMIDEDGEPLTAHTKNPVPFIICEDWDVEFHEEPELYRIPPALLSLNGISYEGMVDPLFVKK